MTGELRLSDKLQPSSGWRAFLDFVQQQSNRLSVGHAQYGAIRREKQYMKRIGLELRAYRRTGNREHLLNIANYAWLESEAPENRRFHWDAAVESVTRGRGLE